MQPDPAAEDWGLLTSLFPPGWEELGRSSNALKGLRRDKSAEACLRVLLPHLGCGHSLRETAVRAREAGLAQRSDVALLKRLRKSGEWLRQLCRALLAERGVKPEPPDARPLRLVDGTAVKEPGPTGSLWRIHYSLRWPALACDHFTLTPTRGAGTGESLQRHPIEPQDHLVADRGYCQASGLHFAARKKAHFAVRLNPHGIRLQEDGGTPFGLPARLAPLQRAGEVHCWRPWIPLARQAPLPARLCVVRKSRAAADLARHKLHRKAAKNGSELRPETLFYAEYVMVLTTFPEADFSAERVLECHRLRWQVELVFKRLKQIARLGHLPKRDDDSAKAWLYGKRFVALLSEKLIEHARAFSPWGYGLPAPGKPVA